MFIETFDEFKERYSSPQAPPIRWHNGYLFRSGAWSDGNNHEHPAKLSEEERVHRQLQWAKHRAQRAVELAGVAFGWATRLVDGSHTEFHFEWADHVSLIGPPPSGPEFIALSTGQPRRDTTYRVFHERVQSIIAYYNECVERYNNLPSVKQCREAEERHQAAMQSLYMEEQAEINEAKAIGPILTEIV